jgi:subfamily B ATP-binding cassette protein MsbA
MNAPKSPSLPGGTISMLRRLFREHGRKHIPFYILAFAMMGVGSAATAASAYLLKPVLNHMVDADGFKALRILSWQIFGLFLLRGVSSYVYAVILARVGNRIIATLQSRLFDHILRMDMRYFQDRHSSEFMTRIAMSAGAVRDTLQLLVVSLGRDVLTVIGLVTVMIVQDPKLSIIALSVMPVGGYFLSKLIKRVRKFAHRSYGSSARILQTLQETVQGIRIVKSFNLEPIMAARMNDSVREVEKNSNRMTRGMAVSSPLADVFGGFAIAAVIFYGSWRVTIADGDAGSFFSFIAAVLMAYEPAKKLARLNLELQNGLVGARMIYEVLDTPAGEAQTEGKPKLDVKEGRIVFDDVHFSYRPGEPVLDGLNFVGEPNATTALVGPSGSGKSTIISMIQRFYRPESGVVRIDDQDIGGVDLASLRDKIAFVSQDVFLFRGTIRENIALGRPGATKADIEAAARHANAHDFIMAFAQGYDTQTGEQGAQLSGGQRQRIAIARAILKNAPIILLDEPTAALDSESEREVQKALDDLRHGRTTIIVAHRLQTIVNADRICVIEAGRLVEAGAHAELLARKGHYHAFFSAQFGEKAAASPSI